MLRVSLGGLQYAFGGITKMKNLKIELENGRDRINDIKQKIQECSSSPQYCKAEVYEMWNNIFDEEEEDE